MVQLGHNFTVFYYIKLWIIL